MEPVARGLRRQIDADCAVVLPPEKQLLAPVAEDVALIAGRGLGMVVGQRACQRLYGSFLVLQDDFSPVTRPFSLPGKRVYLNI